METTRTIDELLEHTAWVRRLARSMVRDESTADDLAQEAMLVALRRPPRSDVPLRAWMSGVLRNIAASWRRRDALHAPREELGEVEVEAASTDDIIGQVEVERSLVAEVLRLSDPYKRTVLLRYFQGLSSAEIARRTATPEGTVRWRLKRGLDQLRAAMDERHEGRSAWVLALLPGLREAGAPAIGAAVSGGSIWWSAWMHPLGLLFLALSAALWLLVGPALLEPPLPEGLAVLEPERGPSAVDRLRPSNADTTRADFQLDAERQPSTPALPAALFVSGHVYDSAGNPLAGALVAVPDRPGNPSTASAPDGGFALLLTPGPEIVGEMIELRLVAAGHVPRAVPVHWRGERALELGRLDLSAGATLRGSVRAPDGGPGAGVEVLVERLPPRPDLRERTLEQRAYLGSQLPEDVERTTTDAEGGFVFEGLPVGYLRIWARAPGTLAAHSDPIGLQAGHELPLPPLRLGRPKPEQRIVGKVLDPAGRPVPRARIEALRVSLKRPLFSNHRSAFATVADELGEFELLVNPAPRLLLGARDPDERWADSAPLEVAGGARDLRLVLVERRSCELRARSEDGRPIEAFTLQVFDELSGQRILGPLRGDPETGNLRFELPNEAFRLIVGSTSQGPTELGPFDPREPPEVIECTLLAPRPFHGRVFQNDLPVAGVMVRFHEAHAADTWRESSAIARGGAPISTLVQTTRLEFETDIDGRYRATRSLPPRFYVRIDGTALGAPSYGPFERESLDPEAELSFELPRPGGLDGLVLSDELGSAAGLPIGVSNGFGRLLVQRTDASGRFRFEELAPGPWQVRALTRDLSVQEEGTVLFEHGRAHEGAIAWDVLVESGQRSHALVDLRERSRVWLAGRVRLGGRAPGPWVVRLAREDGSAEASERWESFLDANGSFHIELARVGSYTLEIEHCEEDRPAARIEDRIDVALGGTRWSYELDTATIRLQPPPGGSVPGARLTYLHEGPGEALFFAAFERDGQLRAKPIEVPAGPGRVLPVGYKGARRDSPTAFELTVEPDQVVVPLLPPDALGGR